MQITIQESHNLYESLVEWRTASQRMRWAYYEREGIPLGVQDEFYDRLIEKHKKLAP